MKDTVTCLGETIFEKEDNWGDAYWNRDSNEEFIKLCSNYENNPKSFTIQKHPKDLSLREFVVNFSKKWKYAPSENVFPHFFPTYRYVVHKGMHIYEDYCRSLLLADKPGCTIYNVGSNFESCEEELRDFVENSPFCPDLIKKDFLESQIVKETNKIDKYLSNISDELFQESVFRPENEPDEQLMQVFGHGVPAEDIEWNDTTLADDNIYDSQEEPVT